MDLRSIIQKIETLEKKQMLTESATINTIESNVVENNTIVQQENTLGAIATALLKEFGLEEAPSQNPWTGKDEEKAAAWSNLSPEDQKWLGGADPTDEFILARAPNKGQPAAPQQSAQPAAQPAAPIGGANDGDAGDAEAQANMAQTAAPQQSAQPAAPIGGANDGDAGDAEAQANMAQTAAPQQSAQPAAPKPKAKQDSNVLALQQKLIAAGANIKADGIMGPRTQAAMKQFPQAVSGNVPVSAFGVTNPSTAGAGRGGQGGPTAAQMATAPQQSAQPANPAVAKIDAEIKRFTDKGYDMNLPANQRYIQKLQAQRQTLLNQPQQSAQPASQTPQRTRYHNTQPAAVQTQSVQNEDDAILERIKNFRF